MSNFLGNILNSDKFLFYTKIIGSAISGGTFVVFLMNNQIENYKSQNENLKTKYDLSEKLDAKKCEDEKTLMKINIENSMLLQYKKFSKKSRESKLFLETIDLLNEKTNK